MMDVEIACFLNRLALNRRERRDKKNNQKNEEAGSLSFTSATRGTSKFTDDTKIRRLIRSNHGAEMLQGKVHSRHEWSNQWLMKFTIDKCRVVSEGDDNPLVRNYTWNNRNLGHSNCGGDLSVRVGPDLRPRSHCLAPRNRAKSAGLISWSVSNRRAEIIKLYLALVRPHLHYAVQFLSPCYRKDIWRLPRSSTEKNDQCCVRA